MLPIWSSVRLNSVYWSKTRSTVAVASDCLLALNRASLKGPTSCVLHSRAYMLFADGLGLVTWESTICNQSRLDMAKDYFVVRHVWS